MADSINLMLDEMIDDLKTLIDRLEHHVAYNRIYSDIELVKNLRKKYFGENP